MIIIGLLILSSLSKATETYAGKTLFPRELKLVYFHDFEPLSWKSENGEMKGIYIDFMNETLKKRLKIEISHEGYPWARAQKMVQMGRADGFVTFPSQERKKYTRVSREVLTYGEHRIYTAIDSPMIPQLQQANSLGELREFQFVDYIGNGWAKETFKGMNVIWVPTMDRVFEVLAGRKKLIHIGLTPVIRYLIKQGGHADKVCELPQPLDRVPIHLCIGVQSPFTKIIPEFDRVFKEMKKDGTYQNIFERYQ
ncbi:MAG: transporter substrate-binding domain-containing protein [Desulfobacterium sp.]|nr:transporter substrate-binding domain-containing protein [Desulfobacterium sp.]